LIDYEAVREIALREKPKMIVAGASAYSRIIDFKKFREIAENMPRYGNNVVKISMYFYEKDFL